MKVSIKQAIADTERLFGFTETTKWHKMGDSLFVFSKDKHTKEGVRTRLIEYWQEHPITNGCFNFIPAPSSQKYFIVEFLKYK